MVQNFHQEGAPLVESPRPLLPGRQESVHPGLRPSLTNIPVTPGITLGEYDSEQDTEDSYFVADIKEPRETMAQSPSDAAAGATSNADILRRMSLSSADHKTGVPAVELDPRAANPTLGLSGGIISATFCIPHSLKLRKGADWVRQCATVESSCSNCSAESRQPTRHVCFIRLLQIPLLR